MLGYVSNFRKSYTSENSFLILQGVHVGQIALLPVLLNVSHHVALHLLLLPQCQCLDPQDNQAAWDPLEHQVVVEHQALWDQWVLWVQWDLQEHPECPAWLLLLSSVHQSACAGQPPFLQEEGCLRCHQFKLLHAPLNASRLAVVPLLPHRQ